jgi:hypothetical protein
VAVNTHASHFAPKNKQNHPSEVLQAPRTRKEKEGNIAKKLPSINAHFRFPCGRHVVYLKMERL